MNSWPALLVCSLFFHQVLLETYTVNHRMNKLIIEHLEPLARRTKPSRRNARTIAAIFAHAHKIRRKWLRLSAPCRKLPAQLDCARSTPHQARIALKQSARRCSEMLTETLGRSG